MRYGIPTGYKPKINKKKTLQYAYVFTDRLVSNLLREFDAIAIDYPATVDASSGLQPAAVNRPIAFDTLHSAKIHRVLTDPDCFLSAAVTTYAPDFGRCLMARGNFINRDVKVSSTEGVNMQSVILEGRVVASDAIEWRNYLHELAKKALSVIDKTVAQLAHFHNCSIDFGEPYLLSFEDVKKRFWAQNAGNAIDLATQKHGLVLIDSPRLVYAPAERVASLVSNDLTKNVWCCYYAAASESALTFFELGIRPDAVSLQPLENLIRDPNKYGGEFVEKLLAGEVLPTFYIKFNVSHLLMSILSKAHVAEVVSSVWSEDFLRHCLTIGLEIM